MESSLILVVCKMGVSNVCTSRDKVASQTPFSSFRLDGLQVFLLLCSKQNCPKQRNSKCITLVPRLTTTSLLLPLFLDLIKSHIVIFLSSNPINPITLLIWTHFKEVMWCIYGFHCTTVRFFLLPVAAALASCFSSHSLNSFSNSALSLSTSSCKSAGSS